MVKQVSKKFAVFDIDGTLIRWQLYHAINDALVRKGLINAAKYESVRTARMQWKERRGDKSFREYEALLVQLFEKEFIGLSEQDLQIASEEVFNEYKDQVYTYSRDLLHGLKAKGYVLFAISGSTDIIVEKLAKYYGFDDYAATKFIVRDGVYSGEVHTTIGHKATFLDAMVKKHSVSYEESIGLGDSEGDISMLNKVATPIAFNPNHELFTHATKHGWQIVIERKNVIYTLDANDGAYTLREK